MNTIVKNIILVVLLSMLFIASIYFIVLNRQVNTSSINEKPVKNKQLSLPVSNIEKNERVKRILFGIAYIESRYAKDPYKLVSKPSKNGDKAHGKYQIMGKYIPAWTKEATGKSYTKEQFLNSPDLQEKTAAFLILRHVKNGYSDNDIASIWFSGRPMKKAGNAKDVYGTSVPTYVKIFNIGLKKYDTSKR